MVNTLNGFETYLIHSVMENRNYNFIVDISFSKEPIAILFGKGQDYFIEFRKTDEIDCIILEIGIDAGEEEQLDIMKGNSVYRYHPYTLSMAKVKINYNSNSEHPIDDLNENLKSAVNELEKAASLYFFLEDTSLELKRSYSFVKPLDPFYETNEYYNT